MTAPLRRVLLKHPAHAFIDQATIDRQWEALNYRAAPRYDRALTQYDAFIKVLHDYDVETLFLPVDEATTLDAIYTHDPVLVTRRGAVLCNMGKPARRAEPAAIRAFCEASAIPVHGSITGAGRLEGGDVVWLDARTVAVGEGYRTNAEGIRQLGTLLGDLVDTVIPVPLPHWNGPADVLHLMSFFSPVDDDLAVVYSRLMPVPFRQFLLKRGITFIEVPDDEYATLGCNVLALAPRVVLLAGGNPQTQRLLEEAGATVHTYDGSEISRKGEGGPTCLTRPLWRQPYH